MNNLYQQQMRRCAMTSLVVVLLAHPLAAQSRHEGDVTEQVRKERGCQLQQLVLSRTKSQLICEHDFAFADLRGLELLRPNLSERLAGLSFNESYSSSDYQSGKDVFTANLGQVRLQGARLDGVDLHGVYMAKANLRNASLRGTNLREAILNQTVLSGADLSDADLSHARLSGADLRDANLSGADLSGANLRNADLRDANLSGTDLSRADLRGARR